MCIYFYYLPFKHFPFNFFSFFFYGHGCTRFPSYFLLLLYLHIIEATKAAWRGGRSARTPETCDKLNKVACSAHQNELAVQRQQAANQKSSGAELTKNYAFRARGGACKSRTPNNICPRFFLQFIRRSSGGNQLSPCVIASGLMNLFGTRI